MYALFWLPLVKRSTNEKKKRKIDLLLSDVGSALLISGPELKYFNQMSQTDLRSAAICANEEKDLTVTKTITVHIHA